LILKTCKVKLHWFSKQNAMGSYLPSGNLLCLGWGLILLLPREMLVASLPFVVSLYRGLVPRHISAPRTFFNVASSLQLTVGLFCQSLGHFQNQLCACSGYLDVSMGGGNSGSSYSAIFLYLPSFVFKAQNISLTGIPREHKLTFRG